MTVELIETVTEDGIRLHGALCASGNNRRQLVVCVHGVGSNFYGSSMMNELSNHLACAGLDTLRVNTRGHDNVFTAHTPDGPTRLGAAYEIVDHCRIDITAWAKWGAEHNYQQVTLLGHSLGAIKVLYAQAFQPHPVVSAVVALSAPRLSASLFRQGPQSVTYLDSLQNAEQKIEQNCGGALIEIQFPFPMVISAASFHDKYGPEERYNLLRFVDQIRLPTLYVYGGEELEYGGVAFSGLREAIQDCTSENDKSQTRVVPGADHLYQKTRQELFHVVGNWLK